MYRCICIYAYTYTSYIIIAYSLPLRLRYIWLYMIYAIHGNTHRYHWTFAVWASRHQKPISAGLPDPCHAVLCSRLDPRHLHLTFLARSGNFTTKNCLCSQFCGELQVLPIHVIMHIRKIPSVRSWTAYYHETKSRMPGKTPMKPHAEFHAEHITLQGEGTHFGLRWSRSTIILRWKFVQKTNTSWIPA